MRQLYLNWRTSRGREKTLCWWGRMRFMLRRIWPQCDLHFRGDYLTATGDAIELHNPNRSRARYIEDLANARWQARQRAVLAQQMTDRQQEYMLQTIFQELGHLEKPLFWVKPNASINAVHALVRTFAGVEDFARVNAHHFRRMHIVGLANERFSRCCLTCLTHTGKRVLDSEWHALFDCPSHEAARGRFVLATKFSFDNETESTAKDLSRIVTYTRNSASWMGELAKFLLNIRPTRRHNHRHLTSNGPNGRSRVIRRLVWDCWRAALSPAH